MPICCCDYTPHQAALYRAHIQWLGKTLVRTTKERDELRDGLQNALAAIDWMFAAKQPLRDPWFTHRDALIARAREALERHKGS
jgi:hypothetical protein